MTTTPSKLHSYKGWTFQQARRSHWILVRISDGYTSWHRSFDGCRLFISQHGTALNPDASYELATA
jgi:hypothetical protein